MMRAILTKVKKLVFISEEVYFLYTDKVMYSYTDGL